MPIHPSALKVSDVVQVSVGCAARQVKAHSAWVVTDVSHLGPDHGHQVRVVLRAISAGPTRSIAWYARHANRLSDPEIRLNDGNPLHRIRIKRTRSSSPTEPSPPDCRCAGPAYDPDTPCPLHPKGFV